MAHLVWAIQMEQARFWTGKLKYFCTNIANLIWMARIRGP
jgi:hypothetical protein